MREDLEEPVPPMMPMVSPERMCRSMSCKTIRRAEAAYLKLTPSKSTAPSATVSTGSAGSVRVLRSERTSAMRLPDSPAMVIITKTMDTIIRLLSIIKL